MAKKHTKVSREVFAKAEAEAINMLSAAVPSPNKQLCLFEEFSQANEVLAKKNPKSPSGLTLAQEIFARLVAAGHSQTESYLSAYPACKTSNLNTVYSKASHLAKTDKVGARIAALKEKMASEALMSPTELYQRLTDMARNGGKVEVRLKAAELIGKIHGVFQPDKETSVTVGPALVVQTVDYSAAKIAADKKATGGTETEEAD